MAKQNSRIDGGTDDPSDHHVTYPPAASRRRSDREVEGGRGRVVTKARPKSAGQVNTLELLIVKKHAQQYAAGKGGNVQKYFSLGCA